LAGGKWENHNKSEYIR